MFSIAFLRENMRWLGAGFLLSFSSAFGQTFFISLFSGELRETFDLSHGELGSLYTTATVTSAATLIWLGKLADTKPLGMLSACVIAGLATTAIAMASVASAAMLLFVLYGLRLFGQGMMSHICFTAMGRWFNARRGQAVAIAGMGFPMSEAVFPFLAVSLTLAIGWRQTWVVCAVALLAVSMPLAYWLLRQGRTPQSKLAQSDRKSQEVRDWTRREVLADPLFYTLLPGILAPAFIVTGVFFHQVHLVEEKGWDLTVFAVSYSGYAVGSLVTGIVAGLAVDRWSARHLLSFYLLPMALGLVLLAEVDAPIVALVFMTLTGISAGTSMTMLGAIWPELYGTRHLGSIRAMMVAAMVFATGASPGLVGVLIDIGIDLETQILVSGAYSIVASVLFAVLFKVMPRLNGSAEAA